MSQRSSRHLSAIGGVDAKGLPAYLTRAGQQFACPAGLVRRWDRRLTTQQMLDIVNRAG